MHDPSTPLFLYVAYDVPHFPLVAGADERFLKVGCSLLTPFLSLLERSLLSCFKRGLQVRIG